MRRSWTTILPVLLLLAGLSAEAFHAAQAQSTHHAVASHLAQGYGNGMKNDGMGQGFMASEMVWLGYYDGHKDWYMNTDVSRKGQAMGMHINYSAALNKVPFGTTPAIYLVKGRAVANQIAVFGSEPGESDYSPLWHEVVVTWKANATPVLLVRDDQINDLAKKGQLTARVTHIILNCPIIKVGKHS